MDALDTEHPRTARSALRYRPIDTDQIGAGPLIPRARRSHPDASQTFAPAVSDDLEPEAEKKVRLHRRSMVPLDHQSLPQARPQQRVSPLFMMILGLLLALFLWFGIAQLIAWGTTTLNTWKYGYPRTFQLDAVVGHGDSFEHPSHFVAINLRGNVTILEFPSGDPSRVRVLATTSAPGPNADLAIVTLRFVDVQHTGRPDLLVDIDGLQNVLVNDGKTFRPPTPAEQQQILQDLR